MPGATTAGHWHRPRRVIAGPSKRAVSAPAHLDDERMSSLLDGIGDPEDAAHVALCALCASRFETWRDAARLVAARTTPVPDAQRDAAVSCAVAMAPLRSRRHRRHRRMLHLNRVAALAAAAAVVVGAGGGIAALAATGNGSSSPSAHGVSGASAGAGASAAPPVSSTPDFGPAAAQSAAAGASAGSGLGRFESVAAVVAALRSVVPGAAAGPAATDSPSSSTPATGSCAAVADSAGGAGPAVYRASLTYRGTPASVFVFDRSGQRVAVIVETAGCRVIARASF